MVKLLNNILSNKYEISDNIDEKILYLSNAFRQRNFILHETGENARFALFLSLILCILHEIGKNVWFTLSQSHPKNISYLNILEGHRLPPCPNGYLHKEKIRIKCNNKAQKNKIWKTAQNTSKKSENRCKMTIVLFVDILNCQLYISSKQSLACNLQCYERLIIFDRTNIKCYVTGSNCQVQINLAHKSFLLIESIYIYL